MNVPLAPLEPADLPARDKPFWRMTGPGAVLVGLSIGAGELVVWPWVTARFGSTMIWAAVIGVFIQLWINIEIGRWAISTGESVYSGFARIWGGFAQLFIVLNLAGWLLPGWARTSGNALKAVILGPDHASPDWFWTALTFGAVALLLFGPTKIYSTVEKAIAGMVALITFGLIFVAFRVATAESVGELFRGLTNVGGVTLAKDFNVTDFFSAVVFAGAGGTANLFYAFYLRDKRIGMGARMPALVNVLRTETAEAPRGGFMFRQTEENLRRFRDWLKYVILDQTLYFWLLNSFTILLFIFASLAVLHPAGIVPQRGRLLWDEAEVLARTLGEPGRYLFLVIGMATLFSTQITLTDGVARSLADIVGMNFKFGKRRTNAQWYLIFAVFIMVAGTGLTAIFEQMKISELGFLFKSAYMSGYAMAIYTPLLLYMNLTRLPPAARPKALNVFMVGVAALVYAGFALFCIGYEISSRL